MRGITGCCWPKGISRGSVLAACCEGWPRFRCRTGDKPRETENRALKVIQGEQVSAARQVKSDKQTWQVSGTAQRAALAIQPRPGRAELSTQSRNVRVSAILKCPPWVVRRSTFVNSREGI